MTAVNDSAPVAGIDGWTGGWVAVIAGEASSRVVAAETFAEIVEITGGCAAVGVDMPMWLPESGIRDGDEQLRSELLTGRTSTLFWTPTRVVLDHLGDHAAAVVANKAAGGKGPSAQGFALMNKVVEVRAALQNESPRRHFEVHPESSFSAMNGDVALVSKRSAAGVGARLQLLAAQFPDVLTQLRDAPPKVPVDDVLDAYAAAWTARRIAANRCRWFGPDGDDDGFRRAIAV